MVSDEVAREVESLGSYSTPDADWHDCVESVVKALAEKVARQAQNIVDVDEGDSDSRLLMQSLAWSSTMADLAATHPYVKKFRDTHLPAGVAASIEALRRWIELHSGPSEVEISTPSGDVHVGLNVEVFEHLKACVAELRRLLPWESDAVAAAFVVAGWVPLVDLLTVEMDVRDGAAVGTAWDRIHISAHPMVPADIVVAKYREAQASRRPGKIELQSARVSEAVIRSGGAVDAHRANNAAMGEPYGDAGIYRRTIERAKRRLLGVE